MRARTFSFGVGYDVNSRLLESLSRENFGTTEYVRPEEDIEESVGRLYRRADGRLEALSRVAGASCSGRCAAACSARG